MEQCSDGHRGLVYDAEQVDEEGRSVGCPACEAFIEGMKECVEIVGATRSDEFKSITPKYKLKAIAHLNEIITAIEARIEELEGT